MCIVFIGITLSSTGALAQNVTKLWFDPSSASIQIDEVITLTLEVRDGNDLNAYDMTIYYDEKILNLDSWSHGSYLSNLAVVRQEVKPGMLHLAVTQVATTGVSGNGTLLKLNFRGVDQGNSGVKIGSIELVTSTNQLVNPEIVNGYVEVTNNNSVTITPTVTSTSVLFPTAIPILTSTVTNVLTATPTRTATFAHNTEVVSTEIPNILLNATKTVELVTGHLGIKLPLSSHLTTTAPTSTSEEQRRPATTTEIMEEPNSTPVDRSIDQTAIQNMSSLNNGLVNNLLWVLLVILLVTLGGMILIYARRKNTR